jgi:hypothetical protein
MVVAHLERSARALLPAMKIKVDNTQYDALARSFLRGLRKHIEHSLADAKLTAPQRKDLAASLVFHIASVLDGTANIDHKRKPLIPHLSFQSGDSDLAIVDDGTVALHELLEPSVSFDAEAFFGAYMKDAYGVVIDGSASKKKKGRTRR